jgi:hypothetical protein
MYAFRPEPQHSERPALERALAKLFERDEASPPAYRSEWRRAALAEAVSADEGNARDGSRAAYCAGGPARAIASRYIPATR